MKINVLDYFLVGIHQVQKLHLKIMDVIQQLV